MQSFTVATMVLITISFILSMLSRAMNEQFGFLPQIRDRIPKIQAYTKSAPPFLMMLAGTLFFIEKPFVMIALVLFLISISSYAWSSFVAWEQFVRHSLSSDDRTKLNKKQIILTLIGNTVTIALWILAL